MRQNKIKGVGGKCGQKIKVIGQKFVGKNRVIWFARTGEMMLEREREREKYMRLSRKSRM